MRAYNSNGAYDSHATPERAPVWQHYILSHAGMVAICHIEYKDLNNKDVDRF